MVRLKTHIDISVGGAIEVGYEVQIVCIRPRFLWRPAYVTVRVTDPQGATTTHQMKVGEMAKLGYKFRLDPIR